MVLLKPFAPFVPCFKINFHIKSHCAIAPLRRCANMPLRLCAIAPLRLCAVTPLRHYAIAPLVHRTKHYAFPVDLQLTEGNQIGSNIYISKCRPPVFRVSLFPAEQTSDRFAEVPSSFLQCTISRFKNSH